MKSWRHFMLLWCAALIGIALSTLIDPGTARAALGAYNFGEVSVIPSCPQIYVVGERNGVSIIQLVGGPQIVDQDILAGDLERIGLTTVTDTSRNNAQIEVIVIDSLLSRTQYSAHLARYCNG